MPEKDPFGYQIVTYLWVVVLAAVASMTRYLHFMQSFHLGRLLLEGLSGGLTGLLTFWLCEASSIHGPLSAFLIGVSGLMGARAWNDFINSLRLRFGLVTNPPDESRTEDLK